MVLKINVGQTVRDNNTNILFMGGGMILVSLSAHIKRFTGFLYAEFQINSFCVANKSSSMRSSEATHDAA